jgi:hypothetical protein
MTLVLSGRRTGMIGGPRELTPKMEMEHRSGLSGAPSVRPTPARKENYCAGAGVGIRKADRVPGAAPVTIATRQVLRNRP